MKAYKRPGLDEVRGIGLCSEAYDLTCSVEDSGLVRDLGTSIIIGLLRERLIRMSLMRTLLKRLSLRKKSSIKKIRKWISLMMKIRTRARIRRLRSNQSKEDD